MKILRNSLGVLLLLAAIGFIIYGISTNKFSSATAEVFLDTYLKQIQQKNYKEAAVWSTYPEPSLQTSWTRRQKKLGNFSKWNITRSITEGNLFDKKEMIRVRTELFFGTTVPFIVVDYMLEKNAETYKIINTTSLTSTIAVEEIW